MGRCWRIIAVLSAGGALLAAAQHDWGWMVADILSAYVAARYLAAESDGS